MARLPALLATLKSRNLADADARNDLHALADLLDDYSRTQTTFDSYAAEVLSGALRWTPPHRDPAFWRDNARKIVEHNDAELPRCLVRILAAHSDADAHDDTSAPADAARAARAGAAADKQALAIACNDVACLVKEAPDKRAVLERLGLKARVMQLMQASDEQVRWESLRAVGEWLRYSVEAM